MLTCCVFSLQTWRRGLRVQPADRILWTSSRSDGERGTLLQPILPWPGHRHGPAHLQRDSGVWRRWVKKQFDVCIISCHLQRWAEQKGRKCSNRNCAVSTLYVLKVLHFQFQDYRETANQNRHVNFKMLYHKKWPCHSQFTKIFLSCVTESLIVELKCQYRWILFCNTCKLSIKHGSISPNYTIIISHFLNALIQDLKTKCCTESLCWWLLRVCRHRNPCHHEPGR